MSYTLKTFATGREFKDNYWVLDDPQCSTPSLIRAIYNKSQIEFGDPKQGIYRFADWLPIERTIEGSASPVTYKSEALANKLGLENLYITLSGYYPQRGAWMTTCSFKETEAYSVCGRMKSDDQRVLVVASAGNTARAFAKVCSENNIPLLLCVPADNINALWSEKPLNDCVKLVVAESGSDYFDAIHLSNEIIASSDKFYAEGGAKNIARRDGMATTMLSATECIGRIPDYYFQAVGSGTGAIAAWEANLRLIADGRFGNHKAKLILSQNAPFAPMAQAWKEQSRTLNIPDDNIGRTDANKIMAKVLSNRRPPYGISGGLFDALSDTQGTISQHTNDELKSAQSLFEELEGIDIHPAAAVAVGSLIEKCEKGEIELNSCVMLNITGCGEERFKRERKLHYMQPHLTMPITATREQIAEAVRNLYN